MSMVKDLTGQKFSSLTVIEREGISNKGNATWKCLCDCGNIIIVKSPDLLNSHTKSCGCKRYKYIDLTNMTFGRLTVKEKVGSKNSNVQWLCKCECGNEAIVSGKALRQNTTKSCGCLHIEILKKQQIKKYNSETKRIRKIWEYMKQRCLNLKAPNYKDYGGRGIIVCEEWYNFESFKDWSLNNGYCNNLTLDRIDNNGNYKPSNCRWTTPKEQSNNRRNNNYITYNNITKTLTQWSEEFRMPLTTLSYRIKKNTIKEVFEQLTIKPS